MKNSTLFLLITFLLIIGTFFYYLPYVVIGTLLFFFTLYLILAICDFDENIIIPKKYNIINCFSGVIYFIFNKIKSFFIWLDSKPNLIKKPKKYWRAPENWDKEI